MAICLYTLQLYKCIKKVFLMSVRKKTTKNIYIKDYYIFFLHHSTFQRKLEKYWAAGLIYCNFSRQTVLITFYELV